MQPTCVPDARRQLWDERDELAHEQRQLPGSCCVHAAQDALRAQQVQHALHAGQRLLIIPRWRHRRRQPAKGGPLMISALLNRGESPPSV